MTQSSEPAINSAVHGSRLLNALQERLMYQTSYENQRLGLGITSLIMHKRVLCHVELVKPSSSLGARMP